MFASLSKRALSIYPVIHLLLFGLTFRARIKPITAQTPKKTAKIIIMMV
jgi:hypothetical protein